MARKAKRSTRRPSRGGGSRSAETPHERRIRLYLERHPGATRAQARGHKPREHARREARAREQGRLTEKERAAIKRYASRQAKRMGVDADDVYPDMVAWAREQGFRSFERLRDERDRLVKRPTAVRVRIRKGEATLTGDTRGRSRNLDAMDAFAERYNLPDTGWLYYH